MSIRGVWNTILNPPPENRLLLIRLRYPQGGVEYRLAMLQSARTEEASSEFWDLADLDYDEEHDIYWSPAGWYEQAHDGFEYGYLYMGKHPAISHWMDFSRVEE